jgi:uroporphyrinogen decarboxylase
LEEINELYGDKLTFWGGLSTQDTLPHGTPNMVKEEVKKTIEIFAPGGGFVLRTSSGVTKDTPIENYFAIYEATKKYGKYPIRKT